MKRKQKLLVLGLPRFDPNWPVVQLNSLDIKLNWSNIDKLLKELTWKLSETTISKDHVGTSSKKEISNFGMGSLNTISYDSPKLLPIKVYNIDMNNRYKRPSPPDLEWDDLHLDPFVWWNQHQNMEHRRLFQRTYDYHFPGNVCSSN